MAKAGRPTRTPARRAGGGFGAFLLGFVVALALAGLAGWAWLRYNKLPVAGGNPLPLATGTLPRPPAAHPAELKLRPPFGTSEDVYEAGARLYVARCAACHGTPGHDAVSARTMKPPALQLWRRHPGGTAVGVSDLDPGETYLKIANGMRLTAMPSYQHLYPATQLWDVTLLLKNADQPLPDPVLQILATGDHPPATPAKAVQTPVGP